MEIIYIDETSFNLWQQPQKMWIKPGMKVELPDTRGQSISMIGGLSIHRGLLHTTTFAGSNNTETFHRFVIGLKAKCLDGKCIIVMDNLSVHKSKTIKELFNDEAFRQVYLPPQSCNLNPIEKVWNIVKSQWRRTSYMILSKPTTTAEKISASVECL